MVFIIITFLFFLEEALNEKMKKRGFRFRREIPGDGNCMFHAVADQLERLGERGHDHKGLRRLAVEALRDDTHGVSYVSKMEFKTVGMHSLSVNRKIKQNRRTSW